MSQVHFEHSQNRHSLTGARAVLPWVLSRYPIASLLDVGCGVGTWTKVALDLGVLNVLGIDGVDLESDQLLIDKTVFRVQNLTVNWNLGSRYDIALCLEVAEHVEELYQRLLIENLVRHSDIILFSAACPDQPGQGHVNCRWPSYWQQLFNSEGYVCDDSLRWELWEDERVEAWYRQNIFVASKNPRIAGHEQRLKSVVHPQMAVSIASQKIREATLNSVESGALPLTSYLTFPVKGVAAKLRRSLASRSSRSKTGLF